ncbi:uncharacterized protein LOC110916984 [Helianthus annuus]|uniref:uncharacterized protein LOC110916984 n=1 Tax=Helianthus annuus TaxID=4232 RepID=UPI001652BE5C|nr:uncharacterized protein LOC110916984 [Helianthus annuus]
MGWWRRTVSERERERESRKRERETQKERETADGGDARRRPGENSDGGGAPVSLSSVQFQVRVLTLRFEFRRTQVPVGSVGSLAVSRFTRIQPVHFGSVQAWRGQVQISCLILLPIVQFSCLDSTRLFWYFSSVPAVRVSGLGCLAPTPARVSQHSRLRSRLGFGFRHGTGQIQCASQRRVLVQTSTRDSRQRLTHQVTSVFRPPISSTRHTWIIGRLSNFVDSQDVEESS